MSLLNHGRRALAALALLSLLGWGALARGADFDHRHSEWQALLARHVQWLDGGVASAVDYTALAADRGALQAYLSRLSAVPRADFDRWTTAQQLAFLINAYNAFTVELILRHYPDIDSIKDIGGWFGSPWRQRFFSLLGERRTLDELEHGLIRGSGRYAEPRIHVAVVCASIGCPALRDEAWVADRLEQQLADSLRRFLADHRRNRLRGERLEVSKIFDWYGEDFPDLRALLIAHAAQLGADAAARRQIESGRFEIAYLNYDWALNDSRR